MVIILVLCSGQLTLNNIQKNTTVSFKSAKKDADDARLSTMRQTFSPGGGFDRQNMSSARDYGRY